jgi:hypothetical protein
MKGRAEEKLNRVSFFLTLIDFELKGTALICNGGPPGVSSIVLSIITSLDSLFPSPLIANALIW